MTADKIKIKLNGAEIYVDPTRSIGESVFAEQPCGGKGRCGKCRILADGALTPLSDTERRLLTPAEIEMGVRLACMTRPLGYCTVVTSGVENEVILASGSRDRIDGTASFEHYAVAADIGTTTVAALLYDTNGSLLSEATRPNPQGCYGADVISRIEAAIAGKDGEICLSIRSALDDLITTLAAKAQISVAMIDRAVITGNTVMLSFLVGEDVKPLSAAPFVPNDLFGRAIRAEDLGLSTLLPHTRVYLPPAISAFVGADTTCAILASRLFSYDGAILADIGTNGEMALWKRGELTVCSVAAGPAFEGVGISCGMRAAEGAVSGATICDGKIEAGVIGGGIARGICGSGLLDAVACMLDCGATDESGYMDDDFEISMGVALTPKDIRMVQLAKSAFCAGILTLSKEAKAGADDIDALLVAGGFGSYLSGDSAARIGLFPSELAHKIHTLGNAALHGAAMMLFDEDLETSATEIAHKAIVLDLSKSKTFSEYYMTGMALETVHMDS